MRKLEASPNPDEIKSLGSTPLEGEFPEGHTAEVINVIEAPSASGGSYTYDFETQTGVEFSISHSELEKAIEQGLIQLH